MAISQVSTLGTLTGTTAVVGDEIIVRDVSVASGANSAKRMTFTEVIALLQANGLGGGGTTPPPAQPATFYYGLSTDTNFAASEFTAVPSSTNPATGFAVTGAVGNQYLAFAVPNTEGDITYISPNNPDTDNQFGQFNGVGQTGTVTLGGVLHKYWRSPLAGFAVRNNQTWYVRQ